MINLNIVLISLMVLTVILLVFGYPKKCKPGFATTKKLKSGTDNGPGCVLGSDYIYELSDDQILTRCSSNPYSCDVDDTVNELVNKVIITDPNGVCSQQADVDINCAKSNNANPDNTSICKDCMQEIRYNEDPPCKPGEENDGCHAPVENGVDWDNVKCIDSENNDKICGAGTGTKKATWSVIQPGTAGKQCIKGVYDGKIETQDCTITQCPGCCNDPLGAIDVKDLEDQCSKWSGKDEPGTEGKLPSSSCTETSWPSNDACAWATCKPELKDDTILDSRKTPNLCTLLGTNLPSFGGNIDCNTINSSYSADILCSQNFPEDQKPDYLKTGTCVPIKFKTSTNPLVTPKVSKCSDISPSLKAAYNVPFGYCMDNVTDGNASSISGNGLMSYDSSSTVVIDYSSDAAIKCNASTADECENENKNGTCVWVPPPQNTDGKFGECTSSSPLANYEKDILEPELNNICKNISAQNAVLDASLTVNSGTCESPSGIVAQLSSVPNSLSVQDGTDPNLAWLWTVNDSNGILTTEIGNRLYGTDGSDGWMAISVGALSNGWRDNTDPDHPTIGLKDLSEVTILCGKPILQKHPLNIYPEDDDWNNASNLIVNHWSVYIPDVKLTLNGVTTQPPQATLDSIMVWIIFILKFGFIPSGVGGTIDGSLPVSFGNLDNLKILSSTTDANGSVVLSIGADYPTCSCLNGDEASCDPIFTTNFKDHGIKYENVPVDRDNCMISGQYMTMQDQLNSDRTKTGVQQPSINGCVWRPEDRNDYVKQGTGTQTPLSVLKLLPNMQDFSNKEANCNGGDDDESLNSGFIQNRTYDSSAFNGIKYDHYIANDIYPNLGIRCNDDDSTGTCLYKYTPLVAGTSCSTDERQRSKDNCIQSNTPIENVPKCVWKPGKFDSQKQIDDVNQDWINSNCPNNTDV